MPLALPQGGGGHSAAGVTWLMDWGTCMARGRPTDMHYPGSLRGDQPHGPSSGHLLTSYYLGAADADSYICVGTLRIYWCSSVAV